MAIGVEAAGGPAADGDPGSGANATAVDTDTPGGDVVLVPVPPVLGEAAVNGCAVTVGVGARGA